MKKLFNLSMIAIVLIAAAMTSCGKDEMDIKLTDKTENTFTILVKDNRTGDVIAGAVVKDSKGSTVATTGSDGTATYTQKRGDELIYTLQAEGYASIFCDGGTYFMSKLDSKYSGIATYVDKNENLNPVPSGTELTIMLYYSSFVKNVYKTQVGSDGKFEFTSLPYGADFYFVSPTTIGDNAYEISKSFTAGQTTTGTVSYYYINSELPFAIIGLPGIVTQTGNIVVRFNKAVDTEYASAYINHSHSCTPEWSSDKRTLTLRPTTTWGSIGEQTNIWFRQYTFPVNGVRESVYEDFYVRVVE